MTASAQTRRVVPDEDTLLGMVCVIRPGVVFEYVDLAMTNRSGAPPVEIAEVDDQIGGDVLAFFVDIFRQEDLCSYRLAVLVRDRFDLGFDILTE